MFYFVFVSAVAKVAPSQSATTKKKCVHGPLKKKITPTQQRKAALLFIQAPKKSVVTYYSLFVSSHSGLTPSLLANGYELFNTEEGESKKNE